MIFLTVGTQLPFDRLVKTVDRWAGAAPGREVVGQIGPSALRPQHLRYSEFLAPAECRVHMHAAEAIVAHAGMGTILSALEIGKPVLVLPRRAALGEHRNDHQLATAERFAEMGTVEVAYDEQELLGKLDRLHERAAHQAPISPWASDELITALRVFIDGRAASASLHATHPSVVRTP